MAHSGEYLHPSCPKGLLIRVPSKNDLLLHSVELCKMCNSPITIDTLIVLLLKLLEAVSNRYEKKVKFVGLGIISLSGLVNIFEKFMLLG